MTSTTSTISASAALMLTPNAAMAAANADTAASAARNREHLHVARSFPTERFEDPFWPSFDSRLALTKQHASYLAWRANSEYVADSRGIRSLVRPDQKVGLGYTGTALTSMMAESNDCLLIPLFSLRNGPEEPVIHQVRPDQPRSMLEYQKDDAGAYVMRDGNKVPVLGKDKKPKSRTIKFELPAGSARGSDVGDLPADIHPLGQGMLEDRPDAVLAWTEGAAKADAMLSCALREGLVLVPVALTGVTMGYVAGDIEAGFNPTPLLVAETIGDIDHNGRLELLCWDADWRTNRSVGHALVTFGKLLEAEGAIVAIVDTPGVTKDGKGGIDDYLAQQIRSGEANPLSALLGRALISLQDAELIVKTYSNDDVGRSERLADELLRSHTHTYDPTTTSWNSYDTNNGIWTDHGTGATVDQIAKELTERDATSVDRYAKSRTASAIKSAGVLAAHDPRLQLRSDDCDIDPYLLNTPTGIVDLRTGELLPHSPAFAMRKVTKVGYDPRSTSPVWARFVLQSAGENREYRDYLQRFYGMTLIGRPVEEVIGFITGGGRNGKSTFSSAVQQVLGSYADTFPAKAFTGDLTDEMLIGLQGIRLAIAAETGAGNALDEQAVKTVTSSDLISGRALYKSRVTFAPSATMTLLTNHRPSVRASDEGTWRRIKILPFNNQVTDVQRDPDLKMKLEAESAGILRWLVEGCLEFGRVGLGTCAVVREATAQYRASQDHLGGFITEMLITGEQAAKMHVGRADLKRMFDLYTADQGRRTTWTLASLREGLQERNLLARNSTEYEKKISGYPHWYGIGVRAEHHLVTEAMEPF